MKYLITGGAGFIGLKLADKLSKNENGIKETSKNNFLAILGLVAIIFSIFGYDENTPFPSIYTLIPVLGVVLLILYAEKDTIVAKLLSIRVFVGVGLISYSAYLWHQPIFAFARIRSFDEPSFVSMILLILFLIPLATLSFKLERFFKNPKNRPFSMGKGCEYCVQQF